METKEQEAKEKWKEYAVSLYCYQTLSDFQTALIEAAEQRTPDYVGDNDPHFTLNDLRSLVKTVTPKKK